MQKKKKTLATNGPYSKMAANKLYSFVCMLISPLCLVNMYKKQKNFEVKMRLRGLLSMQTKESFIGRHFGIRSKTSQ